MGMPPPPKARVLRDTSVDESLIYDIHKALPERGTLLNRPPNPYLDIVICPEDRMASWFESFMLAVGRFILNFWRALTASLEVDYERLPPTWRSGVIRGYQPIETGERSEPPQSGSVLASGKYTTQEVADALAEIGRTLYFDAQNRPYIAAKPTPSCGYTPLLSLDEEPEQTEA